MMLLIFLIYFCLISAIHGQPSLSIDCHPDSNATEDRCVERGCEWIPKTTPRAPWCQFTHPDNPELMAGYDITKESIVSIGDQNIFQAKLTRRPTPTLFGADFKRATVYIDQVTPEIMHVHVIDQKQQTRSALLPKWRKNLKKVKPIKLGDGPLVKAVVETVPFGLGVVRARTGTVLVDTRRIPGFTFAQQYTQWSMRVPTRYVYGFGESTHANLKHDFEYRRWGLFTRDHAIGDPEMNLFGVHPFYLCIEDDQGNAHGVFFLNTHAINVALQPDPANPTGGIITWRSIGGAIDFFIFGGPSPDDVIRQYTSIIGRPQFPPYWSMGFQLSRWGYTNLTHLEEILDRNRQSGIAVDTQVIDLDYFYERMDFTYDSIAFHNLSGFVQKLHKEYDMKLVLIIDPALASRPSITYPPLSEGIQMKVFVKDNRTGNPIEGRVWPGETYFVDFSHPATPGWWMKSLADFRDQTAIDFDGIWIDMNEPSNFVDGSLSGCAENRYTKPPYNPLIYENINEMTLCMDADHYAGKHYELHNLFALMEAESTYKALRGIHPGKRPFVLSRSTFAGSGKYTNHWTGDNASNWPQLKYSIVTILEFGMYGMPLMGADICGFHDEATEELCVRWHQMGAFYPFMRNHNDISSHRDQDPGAWSPNATMAIRDALVVRYMLLPYLYTLLHRAHVNGTPVARPVFFDHPNEIGSRDVDDQFLWGSALMIAPVITQGTVSRSVYFPKGRWYDYHYHNEIENPTEARSMEIDMPLSRIGVYLRGGAIVPHQGPESTTVRSRKTPFGLYVSLDENYCACGSLYWDDGESIDQGHSVIQFEAWNGNEEGGVRMEVVESGYSIRGRLQKITVLGMRAKPTQVLLDGVQLFWTHVKYEKVNQTLYLIDLGARMIQAHAIIWRF